MQPIYYYKPIYIFFPIRTNTIKIYLLDFWVNNRVCFLLFLCVLVMWMNVELGVLFVMCVNGQFVSWWLQKVLQKGLKARGFKTFHM